MSFPNIPDINPDISVTFEEAVNLLLTSIAMEEVSLSKLMDAETNKICCVLNDCKHKDTLLHDALKVNKSVDDTIKNMIKLQMLLQFKLENIQEILPATTSTTTTSTSTSTTSTSTKTTTHTTTCTTSTCSTTTKIDCGCSVIGRGRGRVPNCCDEFYGNMADVYAFAFSCDPKSRTVRYTVGNDESKLHLFASGSQIKMQCPSCCLDQLVIYGKGRVRKQVHCKPECSGQVDFILTVCNKVHDILECRMEIHSDVKPGLNHDSGYFLVKNKNSEPRLTICC